MSAREPVAEVDASTAADEDDDFDADLYEHEADKLHAEEAAKESGGGGAEADEVMAVAPRREIGHIARERNFGRGSGPLARGAEVLIHWYGAKKAEDEWYPLTAVSPPRPAPRRARARGPTAYRPAADCTCPRRSSTRSCKPHGRIARRTCSTCATW
jgi:hypothetical protein